jgi:chaperonin GroEL
MIDLGFHPMDVKKGIELASKALVDFLDKIKVKIRSYNDIYNLAMITTNKNDQISTVVAKALNSMGTKGIIQLEESNTADTELIVKF